MHKNTKLIIDRTSHNVYFATHNIGAWDDMQYLLYRGGLPTLATNALFNLLRFPVSRSIYRIYRWCTWAVKSAVKSTASYPHVV